MYTYYTHKHIVQHMHASFLDAILSRTKMFGVLFYPGGVAAVAAGN